MIARDELEMLKVIRAAWTAPGVTEPLCRVLAPLGDR